MAAMVTHNGNTASAPPEPMTVGALGIDRGLVRDLMLKTLFYRGRMSRAELSDELKLSLTVIEELCSSLTQDGLAAVLGSEGGGAAAYIYTLTQKGLERAETALARSGYVGPAPVPLREYIEREIPHIWSLMRASTVTVTYLLAGIRVTVAAKSPSLSSAAYSADDQLSRGTKTLWLVAAVAVGATLCVMFTVWRSSTSWARVGSTWRANASVITCVGEMTGMICNCTG